MKRILIPIFALCISTLSFGQTIFDMYGLNTTSISGDARYMSMGGSFGALGGNATAIMENPAVLGIFRSNELSFSLRLRPNITASNWNENTTRNFYNSFMLNNLNWVFNIPSKRDHGYLNSNFSFGYKRLKKFNRHVGLSNSALSYSLTDLMVDMSKSLTPGDLTYDKDKYDPYDNADIGYLSILGYDGYLINYDSVNPGNWISAMEGKPVAKYNMDEKGYIDDYNFSYSGNVNDIIYFGAGLSMQNYLRHRNTVYSEKFTSGDSFNMNTVTNIKGMGFNFSLGLIARLSNSIRIGTSFITPTYYVFSNEQITYLNTTLAKGGLETPIWNWQYSYRTPFKLQIGVGFIINQKGVINIDYIYSNKSQKLKSSYNQSINNIYEHENADFALFAKSVHTIKLGAEIKMGDKTKIRAGGAYITAPFKGTATKNIAVNTAQTDMEYFIEKGQIFGSLGVGFCFNNIFLDFAYVYQYSQQDFMPFEVFDKSIKGNIVNKNHNFVASLIFKY